MKPSNTTTSGKATDMMDAICTFPRFPCPCTKRHVMLNLTSTGVCNAGTSALYVCNLLLWSTWWWMLLYGTLRKFTSTTMRKKHVRRDPKMCCCCCRFCCGAPTTDETHAPVLHDASEIAYCRYWSRASLPPITSKSMPASTSGTKSSSCIGTNQLFNFYHSAALTTHICVYFSAVSRTAVVFHQHN